MGMNLANVSICDRGLHICDNATGSGQKNSSGAADLSFRRLVDVLDLNWREKLASRHVSEAWGAKASRNRGIR